VKAILTLVINVIFETKRAPAIFRFREAGDGDCRFVLPDDFGRVFACTVIGCGLVLRIGEFKKLAVFVRDTLAVPLGFAG
jgi:hypothetical protein